MKVGRAGRKREGARVARSGAVVVMKAVQRTRQVVVRRDEPRLERQGAPEGVHGLFGPAKLCEQVAEVEAHLGRLWRERQRAAVVRLGPRRIAELCREHARDAEQVGATGLESDQPPASSERFFRAPCGVERPHPVECGRVVTDHRRSLSQLLPRRKASPFGQLNARGWS